MAWRSQKEYLIVHPRFSGSQRTICGSVVSLKLQMYDIGNSTGQIQEDTLRHELKTQNRKCTVKAVATFISCDKWNISISKILEVEPLRVHVSVLTLSRY